ncbi:MAG TPA: Hpt domain-containing protein [Solirubrobacteraceae bacterium]|jgi:HPt (histidine-containing phosphotransfer) domain-containing protein|nr:Hpt domain-containing protein [Solirubrobacteraceae bacterium]
MLRSVWEQQRWRVQERLAVIQRAVTLLADGHLDAGLRREAESAAHMLAGSLGMFGFTQASIAARRLEWELAHLQPGSERLLSTLLASISSDLRSRDHQRVAG